MIDLHTHILPGLDDGARSMDMALDLLQMEQEQGVHCVALTPHFNCEVHSLTHFLERRALANTKMGLAMRGLGIAVETRLGAEVRFSPRLPKIDAHALCIENTGCMLLEFSTELPPVGAEQTLYALQNMGITPVIAHVERYSYLRKHPAVLYAWVGQGALCQANADCICKSRIDRDFIFAAIDHGLIHVLGSDTHTPDKRPPMMQQAFAQIVKNLGKDTARELMENAQCIADGTPREPYAFSEMRYFLGWR